MVTFSTPFLLDLLINAVEGIGFGKNYTILDIEFSEFEIKKLEKIK